MLAQASISVPSTEKWSFRQQRLDRLLVEHCAMNLLETGSRLRGGQFVGQ